MSEAQVVDVPIVSSIIEDAANVVDQVFIKIGIPLNAPKPPTPAPLPNVPQSWTAAFNKLNYAWPGYPWPASFNAEIVAALMSDVLGRLAEETQYSYFLDLGMLSNIEFIFTQLTSLGQGLSFLQSQQTAGASPSQLLQTTQNLQAQLAQVQQNAWNNLWALYNNQVVPLVNQASQNAWNNLWALYNNQVRPAIDAARADANANLWALYNNQVVPLVGQAVASIQPQLAAVQQALTAETARAQQAENTVHNEVTNETARATQAEQAITTSAIPAAVLSLRTALQPQIDALKTETDQCLKPLCDTVTPNAKQLGNLGGLLGLLEALGIGTLIGVLLDEMVHHPKTVADEAATIMGDIGRPIFDGIRALTNI